MISKTGEAESITSHYLFALGSYRGLYILNWIYRYYVEGHYDIIAIISGIVQTILYCDFFYLYITKGRYRRINYLFVFIMNLIICLAWQFWKENDWLYLLEDTHIKFADQRTVCVVVTPLIFFFLFRFILMFENCFDLCNSIFFMYPFYQWKKQYSIVYLDLIIAEFPSFAQYWVCIAPFFPSIFCEKFSHKKSEHHILWCQVNLFLLISRIDDKVHYLFIFFLMMSGFLSDWPEFLTPSHSFSQSHPLFSSRLPDNYFHINWCKYVGIGSRNHDSNWIVKKCGCQLPDFIRCKNLSCRKFCIPPFFQLTILLFCRDSIPAWIILKPVNTRNLKRKFRCFKIFSLFPP